ncbi:MAG TPA: cupredoxin family copper-binding protein, partial [Limnochordales bacterium]
LRHRHAHHVINIIEGANGPNFDASKGNPGDGYGAINYARDAGRGATGAAAVWTDNTVKYLQWADEAAQAATRTQDFAQAGEHVQRALAFLSAALGRPDDEGRLGAALALAQAQGGTAQEVTIEIRGFVYGDGQPVTVAAGTTVTWINHDSVPHTVTGGPLNSPRLNHGGTFSFTFTQAGQYDYICAVHPSMKHTIIVTN